MSGRCVGRLTEDLFRCGLVMDARVKPGHDSEYAQRTLYFPAAIPLCTASHTFAGVAGISM